MTPSAWNDFLVAARGGAPRRVPTALIVDSPWMPGFVGMNTLDFFLYPDEFLDGYLRIEQRFPDVVFIPGFWVEYGMANEPSAFGVSIVWSADSPPAMRPLELAVQDWGKLERRNPETDGLMPLVLRRLERLERHGGLPEPHRIRLPDKSEVTSHAIGPCDLDCRDGHGSHVHQRMSLGA